MFVVNEGKSALPFQRWNLITFNQQTSCLKNHIFIKIWIFFQGETNRSIAAHQLNKQSSRSHCIFTVYLEVSIWNGTMLEDNLLKPIEACFLTHFFWACLAFTPSTHCSHLGNRYCIFLVKKCKIDRKNAFLTDSVHSALTAALCLYIFAMPPLSAALWSWWSISSADPSFLWNTSFIVPLTLAVWHMSIDLVPLWAAEWTESDKHIKLIGLMTITMKKNNSDQTKGKPWTESVKRDSEIIMVRNYFFTSQFWCNFVTIQLQQWA